MTGSPRRPANQKLYDEIKARVKGSVARWPSAYASGMVVQQYAQAMRRKGREPYLGPPSRNRRTGLARWFDERWVDVSNTRKPCGSARTATHYPACRPLNVAKGMTATERRVMAAVKQRAGPRVAASRWASLLGRLLAEHR